MSIEKEKKMKLSTQAITALMMTLQKCLAEQIDITELLSDWELAISEENENEIVVLNPPMVRHENPTVLTGRE